MPPGFTISTQACWAYLESGTAPISAVLDRRQEPIPNELGTAVNVVAMVFGNTGPDSGTGPAQAQQPVLLHAGRGTRP